VSEGAGDGWRLEAACERGTGSVSELGPWGSLEPSEGSVRTCDALKTGGASSSVLGSWERKLVDGVERKYD